MRAPAHLDAAGQQAFRHAVHVLRALGEDPELSRGAVARYASAASDAATLRREWQSQGCPGVVDGPRGGLREHPLLAAIISAERHAAELGDRLGLSPMACRRLGSRVGRPPGAASAPDRASASSPKRTLRKVTPIRPSAS